MGEGNGSVFELSSPGVKLVFAKARSAPEHQPNTGLQFAITDDRVTRQDGGAKSYFVLQGAVCRLSSPGLRKSPALPPLLDLRCVLRFQDSWSLST